jgi:hypothetical protein
VTFQKNGWKNLQKMLTQHDFLKDDITPDHWSTVELRVRSAAHDRGHWTLEIKQKYAIDLAEYLPSHNHGAVERIPRLQVVILCEAVRRK